MSRPELPAGATVVVSAADVAAGYDRAAGELQAVVDAGNVVLLAIMNGGLYPLMELLQRLTGDYRYDYCHATRYRGAREGGSLSWVRRPPASIEGQTVILLDDIFDIGLTLEAVATVCRDGGATQVLSFAQVIKETPERAAVPLPDFTTGIAVPDRYVFGCGMDLEGRWRHLPSIYALPDDSP